MGFTFPSAYIPYVQSYYAHTYPALCSSISSKLSKAVVILFAKPYILDLLTATEGLKYVTTCTVCPCIMLTALKSEPYEAMTWTNRHIYICG